MKFLPPEGPPEIAFAGRSNVGKSSLINALVGQKGLARTSNTPGRTQELNFFVPDGYSGEAGDLPPMALVDMPGYGYAPGAEGAGRRLDEARLRLSQGPRHAEARLCADRRAPWHQEERRRGAGAARQGGSLLPDRADQDRQDQAGRRAATDRRDAGRRSAKRPAAFPVCLATSSEKGEGLDELARGDRATPSMAVKAALRVQSPGGFLPRQASRCRRPSGRRRRPTVTIVVDFVRARRLRAVAEQALAEETG